MLTAVNPTSNCIVVSTAIQDAQQGWKENLRGMTYRHSLHPNILDDDHLPSVITVEFRTLLSGTEMCLKDWCLGGPIKSQTIAEVRQDILTSFPRIYFTTLTPDAAQTASPCIARHDIGSSASGPNLKPSHDQCIKATKRKHALTKSRVIFFPSHIAQDLPKHVRICI